MNPAFFFYKNMPTDILKYIFHSLEEDVNGNIMKITFLNLNGKEEKSNTIEEMKQKKKQKIEK